ncbi:MAG TPA: hypothetical protein VJG66_00255, partial [Patescibacteria group bacterium]|nr:hypothetical protein [Patescibacteria group bacterium]
LCSKTNCRRKPDIGLLAPGSCFLVWEMARSRPELFFRMCRLSEIPIMESDFHYTRPNYGIEVNNGFNSILFD